MNPIPYGRQNITREDEEAVLKALKSDFLTQGPMVQEFEKSLANYLNIERCVAVNSGTAALHVACMALGVTKGDKILVTPNSFAASANCVLYCGGEVEFVDIDPKNHCISISHLKEILDSNPPGTYKGIITVDFAGYPVNLSEVRKIADENNLWVINDAAHAIGAERKYGSNWVQSGGGNFADISTFSFHPVKHIAAGEGGAITTNSHELANKIEMLRTHGITKDPELLTKNDGGWYYEMHELSMNYRIPDILCGLAVSQLDKLDDNLKRRREIAKTYDQELSNLPLTTAYTSEDVKHAYHLYAIQTDQRAKLYNYLRENNIYCQVHYIPIYQQPYYINKYGRQSFANADHYYNETLSLPIFPTLTEEEQSYVIDKIKDYFK